MVIDDKMIDYIGELARLRLQENERESDRVAYAPYILDARVELLLLGFFHEYLRLPSRAIRSSDYNGRDGLHQESVSIF